MSAVSDFTTEETPFFEDGEVAREVRRGMKRAFLVDREKWERIPVDLLKMINKMWKL